MGDMLPLTDARIQQWREDEPGLHGVQLYVSLNGRPVIERGQGEARPGVEMSAHTICRQYCTAAPLTAFALAPFLSRREVGLDQAVSHFVPEFARHGKDRITLRHVLTHTAGLHVCDDACLLHAEDAILAVVCDARLPPGWAPGSKATYSHIAGWHVLGRVIETIAAAPLGSHLRDTLFTPLGMLNTWVGMPGEVWAGLRDRLAVTYIEWDEDSFEHWLGLGPTPMWHDLSEEACTLTVPSSAYAPAGDIGRFYEALLDRERLANLGIAEPAVVDEFVGPQRSGMYDTGLGRVCDYGLGFMVNLRGHHFGDYCSARSFGHSGLNGSSLAFADEERRLVIAFLPTDILDWQSCFLRRTAIVNAVYEDLGLT